MNTVHSSSVFPTGLHHHQTVYDMANIGEYLARDSLCQPDQEFTQESSFQSATGMGCLVPLLQTKDRFQDGKSNKGFKNKIRQFRPVIKNISRAYIRQSQFDYDPYIYLIGQNLNKQQLCAFEANGKVFESQFEEFINEEAVKCKMMDEFFDDDKYWEVKIYVKEYDTQNNGLIYTSNKMTITNKLTFKCCKSRSVERNFLSQTENHDYIHKTNIYQFPNFTYKCVFGANNEYITEPIFESNLLVGCHKPNIIEQISTIPLKIVEMTSDNKVAFSNVISLKLENSPLITSVIPSQVPAFENEPRIVTIKGENFVVDRTFLYIGDFFIKEVSVQSPTIGTVEIPKNMTPGLYALGLTSNHIKQPRKESSVMGLEYIKLPEIKRLVPDTVPSLQGSQKIMIQGQNFTTRTQCVVDGKISATSYITSNLLECEVIAAHAGQEKSIMLLQNNLYYNRETSFKVKFVANAYIYDIQPQKAIRTLSGTIIEIFVANMPMVQNTHNAQYCKFGKYVVEVDGIIFEEEEGKRTNFTKFICRTPFVPNDGQVIVEILNAQGIFTSSLGNTFTFIDPPVLTSASPSQMQASTNDTLISLKGLYFESSYQYYCQFKTIYTFQNDTLATFVSNTQLTCTLPSSSYLSEGGYVSIRVVVKNSQAQILFYVEGITRILIDPPPATEKITPTYDMIQRGNDDFIQCLDFDIILTQQSRVYSISPAYGQANSLKYNTTMAIAGSDLLSKTHVFFGNFSNDNQLSVVSSTKGQVVIPQYVNISKYDNTSTYGDNRASVEVGDSLVFSKDEIVYTYIDSFKISSMTPLLVSPLGQEIIFYGQGFIHTPSLNCKFGNLLAAQVKYYNRTKISCTTPVITDESIPYPISITLNGIEFIDFINVKTNTTWNLTFTVPIHVNHIDPQIAFDDSQNILVTIQANTLVDLPTLSCKIHDYVTAGFFILYNNLTYVSCTIPSYQYLQFTAVTPISNSTVVIEVSNNGIDFSQSGQTFKFIIVDQINGIQPKTGPEAGGTQLNIYLKDLPFSGDSAQITLAQCRFPGYEPQKATYINSTLIQCVTPPLIENIDNVTSNPAYAIAKVDVNLIGMSNQHFYFVYSKGFMVQRFEPPDAYIQPDSNTKFTLNVIGVNFLPVYGSLFCKLYLPFEERIVEATYVNNHTIACDVPSLSSSTQYPYQLRIEISQNGGIQYSNNFQAFTYRMKDVISSLEPKLGYVQGNTYLRIGYSYFYNPSSSRAVCRFALPDLSKSIETRIIAYDNTHLYCYSPPAQLLSQLLYQDGGNVRLYISSNNRDFSDNYQEYTYMPTIQITMVDPLWIVNSDITTITITGLNFFATPLLRVLLLSSDGDRKALVSNVVLASSTQLLFNMTTQSVFINKDFVKVFVSFDDNIFFEAEDRIIVYEEITLIKAKPKYVYTDNNVGAIDVTIFGINFWNTELSEQLKCRVHGSISIHAYFVNVEQVMCSIPMQSTPKILELEVTIDTVRYSINSVQVEFIPPPTITALNVTQYFHTQDETVYVQLQGTNLHFNRDHDGQIFISVDNVVNIYSIEIGQTEIVFEMPKGLDVGIYRVYISTDGQNFLPEQPSPFTIEVKECPPSYFCTQFSASLCPPGYYCPITQMLPPIKCPSGTYSPGGLSNCQTCLDGEYCPRIGMAATFECPGGFICSGKYIISTNQLRICPEGFFCPAGTTTINENNIGQVGNVQPCPNGFWCPEGSKTSITDFGTFDSPQVCRDGQICGQSVNMDSLTNASGARDPFGVDICQLGQYCEAGIPFICPKGTKCDYQGMIEPAKCEPGRYQNETGTTQCKLCPPGSFCLDEGMSMPFRCRPGYVCQFEGSPYPAQLCPAGSFCPISIVTNVTNSTVQKEYRPNYCYAASYCLQGVYTPFINSSNPQAAQQCQGGTFCQEGTKDPNGGGKCLEGYYCPPNSSDMLPTDPGFFSEGRGNEAQEPCRAGTYQDEPAQAACKECPIGYQCPNVQMVKPQKCPQGTYAQKTGQTQCDKCPQGTYSNKFGLTNQNECVDCEPKYFCGEAGLTSMKSATECQEGYQCGYRTTTNSMYNNQCPAGYYCDTGTSGMDDYFLCEPGYFCPAGTSKTKFNQNECLIGYYCPRGTAGDINANGSFKDDIYQLDQRPLIDAINSFISRKLKDMARISAIKSIIMIPILNKNKGFGQLSQSMSSSNILIS